MRASTDTITVLGVIGTDPEAKMTPNGVPLVKFRMASTQRKFDKNANKWIDGTTNWYTVSAFRILAGNAIVSLRKGDPIIVTGRLNLRAWDTGEKQGTSADLEADVIGLDLQWGTARFQRTTHSTPLGQGQQGAETPSSAGAGLSNGHGDAWATPGRDFTDTGARDAAESPEAAPVGPVQATPF